MLLRRLSGLLVGTAVVAAACGTSFSTGGPGSSLPAGATPGKTSAVDLPSLPAAGGGSCNVKITGGVETSWVSPQTMGTLLISYWLSQADRSLLSVGPDEAYMLMNCQSDSGSISLTTTNQTTAAQFPEKPGTYVIEAGGILSDTQPGDVQAIVVFHNDTLWKVTKPGTFVVTTFGGGHFAGTFSLEVGQESDDLSTIVATATVSGTFDLACTGSACN